MAKTKILIVDDSADIVEMVAKRLKAQGYDTVTALNGHEALEKTVSEKPDLILLDVMMPGLDGISVGARLKEDPDTKNIPIIMVTAKGEREDIMKAIDRVGVAEYIVKPFRIDQLLEKINFVLTQYRS
jgi:DNA-binding response OmpR family regulator